MKDKICGTCRYHHPDGEDWICANPESDCFTIWTGYNDTCEDWEGRDDDED